MTRVVLFHWHESEGVERAARLRAAGVQTELYTGTDGKRLAKLRDDPPRVVVIDLSRLPSQGRHVAVFLRQQVWSRAIAIVFAGGEPEKVASIRAVLPDATYTNWRGIAGAIRRAVERPRAAPVVPTSIGGYSGTPLPKKLGIKPASAVLAIGAPADFARTLGTLPEGARLVKRGTAERVLLFCRSRRELDGSFERATRAVAEGGALWIAWPKLGSSLAGDLREPLVRQHGLSRGWVDYKICAIDGTWSGLCFARRGRS